MNKETKGKLVSPIGAGDLVDRAVRLYRRHFLTFVLIVLPPILLINVISVGWSLFVYLMVWGKNDSLAFFLSLLGKFPFWLLELILFFCLIGGLSKNLILSIIFDVPLSFREIYLHTMNCIGLLFLSSLIVLFLLFSFFLVVLLLFSSSFTVIFQLWFLTWGILLEEVVKLSLNSTAFGIIAGYLLLISSILISIAIFLGFSWIFFFIASRFVYVPQVIVVEDQNLFSAILRSISLSRGNTNQVYMLSMFTLISMYIILALLYLPIVFCLYFSNVEMLNWTDSRTAPMWYTIANETIFQISLIFTSPILMSGLCLLYFDEKIRKEGYDVELLAARYLEEVEVGLLKEGTSDRKSKEQNNTQQH